MCVCVHAEKLFVVDEEGSISVFDTGQNPAALQHTWFPSRKLGKYRCLALYESSIDEVCYICSRYDIHVCMYMCTCVSMCVSDMWVHES